MDKVKKSFVLNNVFGFFYMYELIFQGYRIIYYKESENIYDVRDVLEKWECLLLNEMNKCI